MNNRSRVGLADDKNTRDCYWKKKIEGYFFLIQKQKKKFYPILNTNRQHERYKSCHVVYFPPSAPPPLSLPPLPLLSNLAESTVASKIHELIKSKYVIMECHQSAT